MNSWVAAFVGAFSLGACTIGLDAVGEAGEACFTTEPFCVEGLRCEAGTCIDSSSNNNGPTGRVRFINLANGTTTVELWAGSAQLAAVAYQTGTTSYANVPIAATLRVTGGEGNELAQTSVSLEANDSYTAVLYGSISSTVYLALLDEDNDDLGSGQNRFVGLNAAEAYPSTALDFGTSVSTYGLGEMYQVDVDNASFQLDADWDGFAGNEASFTVPGFGTSGLAILIFANEAGGAPYLLLLIDSGSEVITAL